MIRVAEFVLPGHPDKFCDAVADAIIAEVLKVDADGYGQVEVSVWSDQVLLTGSVCTRRLIPVDFADVVVATGIDWLPIEHWLAREFRDALYASCKRGRLKGQGPETSFLDLCAGIAATVEAAYGRIQRDDRRWCTPWKEVALLLNPNGPLLNCGSDGDNGQTGRKLVMNYYGPRVPIGGGALSGKEPTHVDRAGARMAREMALHNVVEGVEECLVSLVYAPGCANPIGVLLGQPSCAFDDTRSKVHP